jgi:GTPase SAR1 family protein
MGLPEQLPDIKLKIILVDLGKNEVLLRDIKEKFGANYKLSVGIEILRKSITFEKGLNGNVSIWDVSGENIFEIVKDLYCKEDGIALIAFDLTKLKTYNQMIKYLSKIRQFNLEEYPYVLIGKKPTFLMKDGLFIYSDDAKMLAESEGCVYLETSSEINPDIDKVFNRLAKIILRSKVPV